MLSEKSDESREQRKYERHVVNFPARWKGDSAEGVGVVKEISLGGCFILSDALAELNEVVRLDVAQPGGKWLTLLGRIMYWIEGEGFGVSFLPYAQEDNHRKFELLVRAAARKK